MHKVNVVNIFGDYKPKTCKCKASKKAIKKAQRKLKKAAKSQDIQTIRILLGMAKVALDKAALRERAQQGVKKS